MITPLFTLFANRVKGSLIRRRGLVESIVRKTLGIKNHVVEKVFHVDEGLVADIDVRMRRRLPCSRLQPIRGFTWTLRRHAENVLTWFDHRISNAAIEGLNNKAKVVARKCYGFRTAGNYITALYHCLGDLPQPKLVHKFL